MEREQLTVDEFQGHTRDVKRCLQEGEVGERKTHRG